MALWVRVTFYATGATIYSKRPAIERVTEDYLRGVVHGPGFTFRSFPINTALYKGSVPRATTLIDWRE